MEKLVSVKEEDMKKYYEDNKETQFKITSVEPKPEESKENKAATKDASTTDKKNAKKRRKRGHERQQSSGKEIFAYT